MASTHLALHCHVVFSTKNRAPIISAAWRERFHAYLGGVIRNVDAIPEAVGGVNDHVHLLIGFKATHCIADVFRDVKSVSSLWLHDEIKDHDFAWQEGYGAFSVSPSKRAAVKKYIAEQEDHHRVRTFQEEYFEMLAKSGVKYDERYLW